MKLSFKLAIIILSAFLISTALVSYFVYTDTREAMQHTISDNHLDEVKREMDVIDRILNERTGDIQAFATHAEFVDLLKPTVSSPELSISARQRLEQLKVLYGTWSDISVINLDGKRILSTNTVFEGSNIRSETDADAKLFSKALAGDIVSTDVFIEDKTGVPVVAFLAPIRNVEGKIVGVIDGYFSWNVVSEVMQDEQDGVSFLLDKNGVIIGSSREKDTNLLFNKKYPYSVITALAAKMQSGTMLVKDSASQEIMLVAYTYEKGYLEYSGKNWILVSQVPESLAFAAAQSTAMNTVLILTVIIFITVSFTILFMYFQVSRPIQSVTKAVVSMSSGNLNNRIAYTSNDELGLLARVFDDMAIKLQKSYEELKNVNADLEKKVQERTNELEAAKQGLEKKVQERTEELEQGKLLLESEITKRTGELQQKVSELERFQKLTIDRELKMIELKKQLKQLQESKV